MIPPLDEFFAGAGRDHSGWLAVFIVASILLLGAAVVRLVRADRRPPVVTALWVVVILAFPIIGPLLFLLATRRPTSTTTPAP